jgi:hypothetical protein
MGLTRRVRDGSCSARTGSAVDPVAMPPKARHNLVARLRNNRAKCAAGVRGYTIRCP